MADCCRHALASGYCGVGGYSSGLSGKWMFLLHLLTAGLNWPGVLPYLGVPISSLLTYLGVRSMQAAPLQKIVNDALQMALREWEAIHARDTALISRLENEKRALWDVNQQLLGEKRQQDQIIQSLKHRLDENADHAYDSDQP